EAHARRRASGQPRSSDVALGIEVPSADQSRRHDCDLQPSVSEPRANVWDARRRAQRRQADVRRQAVRDRRAPLPGNLRRRGRRGGDRIGSSPMATTLAPPSAPPPEVIRSARAELARRESPRRRIIRLVLLLISIAVLVRGWMVTEIDLGKLANAPNAAPILKALV